LKSPRNREKLQGSKSKIRKYEPRDFLEVAKLVEQFFSFHKAFFNSPPMKKEEAEEALRKDMLSRDSSILVYEDRGKILGFARYELHEGAYFGRELMVHEQHRGQGIGKLLLNEVERIINEKGHQLYLSIVPKNKDAIQFFVSAGYNILNTIELTKNLGKETLERRPIRLLNVDLEYY
jgi:ribosomal protein S18 acetylase RimI-like enzyme